MVPADERLHAGQLLAGHSADRLVEQRQLSLLERRAEIGLELKAPLNACVHARVKQRVPVLSGCLGGIQSEVCVA